MHTNLNVSVLEFNRRSVRPNFEFAQLVGRSVLQRSDPLSWNQEANVSHLQRFVPESSQDW